MDIVELVIENVSKKYKNKTAVDNISLNITPGVWGLLGANGAGKTTLMRMIAGLIEPTSGQITYDGIPINISQEKYRSIFGYLPQEFGFYSEFTVNEYLEYIGALKGLTVKDTKNKIEELLEKLSLSEVTNKKISKLSGGMKRRVGIAQALLNDPEVLILDEPTSGLDPGERIRFRNLISEFANNRIVLISTHIVPDVEYISTKNAIIKNGTLIGTGTSEELVKLVENKVWSSIIHINDLHKYEKKSRIVSIKNDGEDSLIIRYLSDKPITTTSSPETPRLEDLYLWLFPQDGQERDRI